MFKPMGQMIRRWLCRGNCYKSFRTVFMVIVVATIAVCLFSNLWNKLNDMKYNPTSGDTPNDQVLPTKDYNDEYVNENESKHKKKKSIDPELKKIFDEILTDIKNIPNTKNVDEFESFTKNHVANNKKALIKENKNEIAIDDEKMYNKELKQTLTELNENPTINNIDKFGPLNNLSMVIVLHVESRLNYLSFVVDSISGIRDIEDVLLIFSHDKFDQQINNFVKQVDFCKTMQIFFPYSTQIYTGMFPGQSPNDCPGNITKEEALKINCNNAKFPDQYGHYRDVTLTQIKHHWWWTANMVFNRLEAVSKYTGLVAFLEEDQYVAEDFIHILNLIQKSCPQSKIFSLGVHWDMPILEKDTNSTANMKSMVNESKQINDLGLSFNRSVWNELLECAEEFCFYDDYNWVSSLSEMVKSCHGHTFWTATLQQSRVLHIENCGLHNSTICSLFDMYRYISLLILYLNTYEYYPEKVDVNSEQDKDKEIIRSKENGGWADTRDHKLCIQMMKP